MGTLGIADIPARYSFDEYFWTSSDQCKCGCVGRLVAMVDRRVGVLGRQKQEIMLTQAGCRKKKYSLW